MPMPNNMAKLLVTTCLLTVFLCTNNLAIAKEFPDFTTLVKKQSASVVNISTEREAPSRSKLPPGIEIPEEGTGNEALDEFLKRFFDYG
ncbi:MAG: hypothetical protein ACPG47_10415, partial [Leucothrix sp.]